MIDIATLKTQEDVDAAKEAHLKELRAQNKVCEELFQKRAAALRALTEAQTAHQDALNVMNEIQRNGLEIRVAEADIRVMAEQDLKAKAKVVKPSEDDKTIQL